MQLTERLRASVPKMTGTASAHCSDVEAVYLAADEIERLHAAVWAAIPWLDELEHMGSIVDQEQRAKTLATLRAAIGQSTP